METVHSINLIVSNPDMRGGRPYIAGTGVRVMDVVMATLFHNQMPDDIAAAYGISLAQSHAALAYYYEDKNQIDDAIREQIAEAKTLKEQRVGSQPPFLFG